MTNIEHYKKLLLEEKSKLEGELGHIAAQNPYNPKDWEPKPEDVPSVTADPGDMADRLEDFSERHAAELALETRLNSVKKALKKREDGT